MRLVRSRVEFEGEFAEVPVLVDREEPSAWGAEANLEIVGRPATRIDGAERVTGRAKYTAGRSG